MSDVARLRACHTAYQALSREMDAWLKQTRRLDPPGAQGGGEDESNYALAWFPHYLITGSADVRSHFEGLLDLLAGWVARGHRTLCVSRSWKTHHRRTDKIRDRAELHGDARLLTDPRFCCGRHFTCGPSGQ